MDVCTCIAESLWCTAEMITTLQINSTSIKVKKMKKKKNILEKEKKRMMSTKLFSHPNKINNAFLVSCNIQISQSVPKISGIV